MRLSEIFHGALNGEISAESVRKALAVCNQEMILRWGTFENETDVEKIFFTGEEEPTDEFYELMEFWEEYGEYGSLLTEEEKNRSLILQIIYETDGNYQCFRNEKLLGALGEPGRSRLEELCKTLGEIRGAQTLKFFLREEDGLRLRYEMSTDEIRTPQKLFNFAAVQNRLLDTMRRGGLITLAAGSKGLTPQRVYGFILHEMDWSVCPGNVLELLRELLLPENGAARLRGDIRGQA